MKNYTELTQIESFSGRLEYLKLWDNNVSSPRHMSSEFYKSKSWKTLRRLIMNRDNGFDLGIFGVYIEGPMYIHHIDPITEYDIIYQTSRLLDPDNLITVSGNTHNLIHYNKTEKEIWVERTPGDTKLW